jgi:hypothetical protein
MRNLGIRMSCQGEDPDLALVALLAWAGSQIEAIDQHVDWGG